MTDDSITDLIEIAKKQIKADLKAEYSSRLRAKSKEIEQLKRECNQARDDARALRLDLEDRSKFVDQAEDVIAAFAVIHEFTHASETWRGRNFSDTNRSRFLRRVGWDKKEKSGE